jgi:hypothetical protein
MGTNIIFLIMKPKQPQTDRDTGTPSNTPTGEQAAKKSKSNTHAQLSTFGLNKM